MTELSDSEVSTLNNRAFGALMGFSENPRADLVALLRSSAPISETVRDELADAIESQSIAGIRLKIEGHEAQKRRLSGIDNRKEWLMFGKEIYPFIQGKNSLEAYELAEKEFGESESYCKKCYYYFKNYQDWVGIARITGEIYALMTDEQMQHVWHIYSINQGKDMKPVPPSGPEYDCIFRDRLAFFQSITHGQKPWPESTAKMFTSMMLIYCDIAPPD